MKILLILILLFCELQAQDSLSIEGFTAAIIDSKLVVQNQDNKIIYQKLFTNPEGVLVDLDNDNVNELLVSDFYEANNQYFYTLFLFSAYDDFNLVDSIYSGLEEPYYAFSDEINGYIIITGSPDFDELYNIQEESVFSPIVCWSYDGHELGIINDQLYSIYLDENEKIISYVTMAFNKSGKTCEISKQLKQAIATVYTNYYHAGEKTNAENFLKNYYLCKDIEEFKNKIKELL